MSRLLRRALQRLLPILPVLLCFCALPLEARVFRDVRYVLPLEADPTAPALDIYTPDVPGPWPVLVQFAVGERLALGRAAAQLTVRRQLLANVALRAAAEQQVADAAAALAFIARHASGYGGDAARLRVIANGDAGAAVLTALLGPGRDQRASFDPAAIEVLFVPVGLAPKILPQSPEEGRGVDWPLLVAIGASAETLEADAFARQWRLAGGALEFMPAAPDAANAGVRALIGNPIYSRGVFALLDALDTPRALGFERLLARSVALPPGLDCRDVSGLGHGSESLLLRTRATAPDFVSSTSQGDWIATAKALRTAPGNAAETPQLTLSNPQRSERVRLGAMHDATLELVPDRRTPLHIVVAATDAGTRTPLALIESPFALDLGAAWYALLQDGEGCALLLRMALPRRDPPEGIWRDVADDARGFVLARKGRQWLVLQYDRDDAGPRWRYAAGRMESARYVADENGLAYYRFGHAGSERERAADRSGELDLRFGVRLGDSECAGVGRADPLVGARFELRTTAASEVWCARAPARRLSAAGDGRPAQLWYGGSADTRWVLARDGAAQGEETLMLFRFARDGEPRWERARARQGATLYEFESQPAVASGYAWVDWPEPCAARSARATLVLGREFRRVRVALEAFSDPRCD